jgi:hypothetical protein
VILLENRRPDWAGGESLAAPRGVPDASRRCKKRPFQVFLAGGRYLSSRRSRVSSVEMEKVGLKWAKRPDLLGSEEAKRDVLPPRAD